MKWKLIAVPGLWLMAKQVKSSGDSDVIGSLPDHILSHILSFLPTKEAIRTSVLSPRWRYLFASMSTFDFTDCLRTLGIENGNNFKNFVHRLLSLPNPARLECFRLMNFSWDDDHSHLYGWISAILSCGVKELVLYTSVSPMLPSHLFTSHSLVKLKLDTYGVINVPADVCLPKLKTLNLMEFTLLDDSIFRLISSCLVLEELDLMPEEVHVSKIIIRNPALKILGLYLAVKGGREPNNLVEINAPNLVQFNYVDDLAGRYTLSSMKCLEKAYIKTDDSAERNPTNLVQAVCNVQSLFLSVDLSPRFSPTSLEPALAFNNLVELELVSPLENGLWSFYKVIGDEGFRFIPKKVPSCLSFHLQEITFTNYYINRVMFETINYFLNHALVLEKLRVSVVKKYYPIEETCVLKKLLRLLRIRFDEPYTVEISRTIQKILRLLRIGINELYSKEESSIIKKLLRLAGGRAIEVSVELKDKRFPWS